MAGDNFISLDTVQSAPFLLLGRPQWLLQLFLLNQESKSQKEVCVMFLCWVWSTLVSYLFLSVCLFSGQPSGSGKLPLSLPLCAASPQPQHQRCTQILVRVVILFKYLTVSCSFWGWLTLNPDVAPENRAQKDFISGAASPSAVNSQLCCCTSVRFEPFRLDISTINMNSCVELMQTCMKLLWYLF